MAEAGTPPGFERYQSPSSNDFARSRAAGFTREAPENLPIPTSATDWNFSQQAHLGAWNQVHGEVFSST
jgi:hypothetical protein